ncbi:MAG: 5'-nucleotidase, lipoprotein e(P4) family, partial [Ostreibacterium sp.]
FVFFSFMKNSFDISLVFVIVNREKLVIIMDKSFNMHPYIISLSTYKLQLRNNMLNILKKPLLATLLGIYLVSSSQALDSNQLTVAVAWKQTAAEYKALYYQAFNIAHDRIKARLNNGKKITKPLAIIMDMDDTILNTTNYWGYLIKQHINFFDDKIWDAWIPKNKVVPTPGSLDFLNYVHSKGIEIFYITSRDQGEKTNDYAMQHLRINKFPNADATHLTVLRDTSNKKKKQLEIAKDHEIVLLMGDSLNDFDRIYYVADVDKRMQLMESTKNRYGRKFILLPNPTDGHWVKAIFGASEPAATDENRAKWVKAATYSSWDKK